MPSLLDAVKGVQLIERRTDVVTGKPCQGLGKSGMGDGSVPFSRMEEQR